MEVIFTKTESGCRTRCKRDDGTSEEWDSPDGGAIPHDLVHRIVATKLDLRNSFYGNIAQGQDRYSVNELAHSDSELASTELLVLLIQSEIATSNGTLHADPKAVRGMYGLRYPDSCSDHDKEAIIDAIKVAAASWSVMGVGEAVARRF